MLIVFNVPLDCPLTFPLFSQLPCSLKVLARFLLSSDMTMGGIEPFADLAIEGMSFRGEADCAAALTDTSCCGHQKYQ